MTDESEPVAEIEEAAVAWFVRLRDPALSVEDRAAWAGWLRADPRHAEAWRELEATWSGLEPLRPALTSPALMPPAPRVRPVTRRRIWRAAAAASVAAVAGGTIAAWPELTADARTAVGERRLVRLEDGTEVVLGAASAFSLDFSEARRRLVLHRGEAFLTVARQAERPFVVEAAGGEAEALGTGFEVHIGAEAVSVAVAEGQVQVSRSGRSLRLDRGQSARYGAFGLRGPTEMAVAEIAAWRQDRLIFRDLSLSEVARELERYRAGRIVVTSDAAARLLVSGVFNSTAPDAVLDAMARALPIRVRHLTPLLVLIGSA